MFLDAFINKYNNTKHRSMKMTPTAACTEETIPKTKKVQEKSKFKIGDYAGISKY